MTCARSSGSGRRQKSMEESLDLASRQSLDKKWASFFYEANIAFNVVRHPAFVSAVQDTAKPVLLDTMHRRTMLFGLPWLT